MKRAAIEILLILAVSMALALSFNALSPQGLRILPKKAGVAAYPAEAPAHPVQGEDKRDGAGDAR